MFNIVLIEPEIPYNTGNIARTCAATGADLHLVGRLGFSLDDKYLKRAGLDYWDQAKVFTHESFASLRENCQKGTFYFATTKAQKAYTDFNFDADSYFVFGKETAGLPMEILIENKENCMRIPMKDESRSLNLSNSAAIILYEALRQNTFMDLKQGGSYGK